MFNQFLIVLVANFHWSGDSSVSKEDRISALIIVIIMFIVFAITSLKKKDK